MSADDSFPTGEPPEFTHGLGVFASPAQTASAASVTVPAASEGVSSVDMAAELRVLAALFADSSLLDELVDKVSAADFGLPAHEAVFKAIFAVDAAGMPVDAVTVSDELSKAGELQLVGGVDGVKNIMASGEQNRQLADAAIVEAISGFSTYVDIVFDRATRRRLMMAGRQIVADASSGKMDAEGLIQSAEEKVFSVAQERAKPTLVTMPQVVAEVARRMAMARSSKLVGVSTGFSKLDELTGGLQPGQMVTIAGRPGMGKSVLLTQICRHIAETTGDLVPIFSYEMTSGEIGMRLLASSTGVSLGELMRGYVPPEMDRLVAQHSEKLAATPLLLDDSPPTSIQGVRSSLRRISRRGKIAAVGLDYLQLVGGSSGRGMANRENEVAEVARVVKLMATEFGAPMVVASQLNRSVESRADKRPMLSDLRESGAIEQDSSLVIFVYRPHVYDDAAPEHEAELIVAKHRNGACGTLYVDWQGPQVRFKDSTRTGPISQPTLGSPPVNSHGANGSGHNGPSAWDGPIGF